MAKRLSYSDFEKKLAKGAMPLEQLGEYVMFDPTTAVPRLVFRNDALLDMPSREYDVDEAIYSYLRKITDKRFDGQKAQPDIRSVVAEGDSWFNLPPFPYICPIAIAEWIQRRKRFRVKNIARWGHTLKKILQDQEYLSVLKSDCPDYFMFTAGGNDLQEGLESGAYIHSYSSNRPVQDYFTSAGVAALAQIESGYRAVFGQVYALYPRMPILCHGYDYPRPLVGSGLYIGQFLRRKGIPDNLMAPIVGSIIDQLNTVIRGVAQSYAQTVKFLDCLRATDSFTWCDDMHPNSDGFEAIAIKFENAMCYPLCVK